jgi:putative ABC transport system permease protein
MTDVAEALEATSKVWTNLLGGIAGVSLLVGGIGIMNILLVSVTERTREIGIRRALGARRSSVRLQFLTEATVLCLVGGLVGVALGVGISQVLARSMNWPGELSPLAMVAAVMFSALVGIAFGYYPAHKASALDPVEALRYE